MAVKYYCPKCGRQFVEWGVLKLEFKCPTEDCEHETLLLFTANELEDKPKPKRNKKRKTIVPMSNSEGDESKLKDDFMGDSTIEASTDNDEQKDYEEEQ
jgi:hypothetical protein